MAPRDGSLQGTQSIELVNGSENNYSISLPGVSAALVTFALN